jgi:hypothetical protein
MGRENSRTSGIGKTSRLRKQRKTGAPSPRDTLSPVSVVSSLRCATRLQGTDIWILQDFHLKGTAQTIGCTSECVERNEVLVDLGCRGLDISEVRLVVNVMFPTPQGFPESHRANRTRRQCKYLIDSERHPSSKHSSGNVGEHRRPRLPPDPNGNAEEVGHLLYFRDCVDDAEAEGNGRRTAGCSHLVVRQI